METLKALIPVFLTISLSGLVLAVALHSKRGDLVYVLQRPAQLTRAILAVLVIPPIVAGILVALLPIDPVVKAGIMVMAISPVPPLVPGKELAVGARKEYAYGIYVAMALLSIISVPIVFALAAFAFGRHDTISALTIATSVFGSVIIPLIIGLVVRQLAPDFAERAWSAVYKLSMLLIVIAFIPILIASWSAMIDLIGNGTLAVMGLVTAACLAGGHLLGGPDPRDRATLAVAASVRHPGMALSIAGATFHDPRVSAAVLLFMLWGLVVAFPYQRWMKGHPAPLARHA